KGAVVIVPSTEMQNNFGKYLDLCRKEQIIITRNGRKRALLVHWPHDTREEVREPEVAYAAEPGDADSPAAAGGASRDQEAHGSAGGTANRVSYREFLELTENSERRYELIDGVVYMLAPPVFRHQKTLGLLHLLLVDFIGNSDTCTPVLAPFDIRLVREPVRRKREPDEDDLNVVQPDLVVICDYRKDLNEKDQYWGVPDLAIEILSPSSRSKDSIKKVDLYMESGIKECWVVDPVNRAVTVHAFQDFELVESRTALDGRPVESVCFPGLMVQVERVFGEERIENGVN
ncbi:MAG: type II toxin-antitoxin system Phd/YefM family antitoxin, partial [Spirochaetaceae bacterium]